MQAVRLALKVDVRTVRGAVQGVPRLAEIFRQHGAGASFFLCPGPDRSGRAIGRLLRPDVLRRAGGTSLRACYGLAQLLYGTLLPSPEIGRRCGDTLRGLRAAGFEFGVQAWDPSAWYRRAATADAAWTLQQMRLARDAYERLFGEPPKAHGALDWQMNVDALRLTQRLGFDYASDCRGAHPFVPVYRAEIVACPQIPTTLPTLDELLAQDGVTVANIHERLLELTADAGEFGHVFTMRAELDGIVLAQAVDRLIAGWMDQGYELTSLREVYEDIDLDALPRHEVTGGSVAGRGEPLVLQGEEFLPLSCFADTAIE